MNNIDQLALAFKDLRRTAQRVSRKIRRFGVAARRRTPLIHNGKKPRK